MLSDYLIEEGELPALSPVKKTSIDPNKYVSYRFNGLNISEVTIENSKEKLVPSLADQVEMFLPP